MTRHLSIFFSLFLLFCLVFAFPYRGTVTATPQIVAAAEDEEDDEDNDEDEDESEDAVSSNTRQPFTVERGTISIPDGVKLAVSYWMPKTRKPGEKFPVFFEMNGYRKDDLCYLSWDYPVGAYFARHGYVVAKVDLRGTGDSGGIFRTRVVRRRGNHQPALQERVVERQGGDVRSLLGSVQFAHDRPAQTAGPQGHSHRPCLG